jgi:hypothetical protein
MEVYMADKNWADRTTTSGGNRPTVIFDNGHGTRLKLWTNQGKNGEYETGVLETGYYDSDQKWIEQKVQLNKDTFLAIARAFEHAHDAAVAKELARQAEKSAQRAA